MAETLTVPSSTSTDVDEDYHHHLPGDSPAGDGDVAYCGATEVELGDPGPDPCCPTCRAAMAVEGVWQCVDDPNVYEVSDG